MRVHRRKTCRKLVRALGVSAGMGLAALPMAGTFALSPTSTADQAIGVRVSSYISLSADDDGDYNAGTIKASAGASTTVQGNLNVSTNSANGYNITAYVNGDTNAMIHEATGDGTMGDTIEAATSGAGWSIRAGDSGTETVVPAGQANAAQIMNNENAEHHTITEAVPIIYRVEAKEGQLAGHYTVSIVYTATTND